MCKVKCMCNVRESAELAPSVYSLWLEVPAIAEHAVPGQFVSLFCRNRDHLLPRPISICEIDRESGLLRLVYRVVGTGTKEFSGLSAGDSLEVMGPLGNGFVTGGKKSPLLIGRGKSPLLIGGGKSPLLIGGGIGVPPMLELAKQLSDCADVTVVLGYRDSNMFLKEEFERYARVVIATDDGSVGTKGTVIDAIMEQGICASPEGAACSDVICACGPLPMLRGVRELGLKWGIPVYLSMEERMACGIGACLGCVCQSAEVDSHSKVNNKRVCKDGPVFLSTEIEL